MNFDVKSTSILRALLDNEYHPKLIEMVCWIIDTTGMVYVTSAFRPGDPGVHGTIPCRGMDLRSWIYSSPIALCRHINEVFKYDPRRRPHKRCAKVHRRANPDGTYGPIHIHLQVHPKTEILKL